MRAWFRVWWIRVPEPRVYSLGWGAAYAVLCLTGLAALYAPPLALVDEFGRTVIQVSIGGLNVIGTLIAMTSGYYDFWKGERLGIGVMSSAAAIFAGLLIYLHGQVEGSTLVALGYVVFTIVVLLIRYLMIRWYTFRPKG